jgi:hypothetical protein
MSATEFLKAYEETFIVKETDDDPEGFPIEEVNSFMRKFRDPLVMSGANPSYVALRAEDNKPYQYRRSLMGALTLIEHAYYYYADNSRGSDNRVQPGTLLHEMNHPKEVAEPPAEEPAANKKRAKKQISPPKKAKNSN